MQWWVAMARFSLHIFCSRIFKDSLRCCCCKAWHGWVCDDFLLSLFFFMMSCFVIIIYTAWFWSAVCTRLAVTSNSRSRKHTRCDVHKGKSADKGRTGRSFLKFGIARTHNALSFGEALVVFVALLIFAPLRCCCFKFCKHQDYQDWKDR